MNPSLEATDSPTFAIPGYKDEADFLREMRERYRDAEEHWAPQYERAAKAMEFAFMPDKQWDDWMSRARAGRPKYTFNKVRQAIKQVTNDQRQNRPQPKVRAVTNAAQDMAEIREGLFRSIERLSTADRAYDTSFQFAVGGGFGVWRITTDYADEGSFDQDIQIREIRNPFSVLFDPAAKEADRRDSRFVFMKDRMPRAEYKRLYPGLALTDFEGQSWAPAWSDAHEITVCEYWFKVRQQKTIVLLSDGRTVDLAEVELILDELEKQGITELKRREVEFDEVRMCVVSGAHILRGPDVWAGKFIPFVPVWGDIINLRGRDYFFGMTDFAIDAQRLYNFERSVFAETLAKQPKSPLMATPAMIEGHEEQYESLGSNDPPVLLYNVDPTAPGGRPHREQPPAFPAALANAAQISNDDIKATTGKYDASLGARSNETSGRAILARQREGDVSSFDYIDNLAYAQKYSYEIIDDLIPKIIDTQRQITIIGADETEKVIEVNRPVFDEQTGKWVEVNDFTAGRFSIAVTVGPSFTTQRLETADAMMQLSNDPSPIGMLAKYYFISSLDTPGMDEFRTGARKVLVGMGLLEPSEEQGDAPPPAPPGPNPKDVADAEAKIAAAELARARAAQISQDTDRQVALDQIQFGGLIGAPAAPVSAPLAGPMEIPGGIAQDPPVTPAPGGFPG